MARSSTMKPLQPWADALLKPLRSIASRQGRILAIGSVQDIKTLASRKTQVIDLDSAFVIAILRLVR